MTGGVRLVGIGVVAPHPLYVDGLGAQAQAEMHHNIGGEIGIELPEHLPRAGIFGGKHHRLQCVRSE